VVRLPFRAEHHHQEFHVGLQRARRQIEVHRVLLVRVVYPFVFLPAADQRGVVDFVDEQPRERESERFTNRFQHRQTRVPDAALQLAHQRRADFRLLGELPDGQALLFPELQDLPADSSLDHFRLLVFLFNIAPLFVNYN